MLNIPGLVTLPQPGPRASDDPPQNTNLHPTHKPAIPLPKPQAVPPASTTANPCLHHRLACLPLSKLHPLRGPLRGAFGATHPPPPSAASGGHLRSIENTVISFISLFLSNTFSFIVFLILVRMHTPIQPEI